MKMRISVQSAAVTFALLLSAAVWPDAAWAFPEAPSDCSVFLMPHSPGGVDSLSIGDPIHIQLPGRGYAVSGYFVGRYLRLDGTTKKFGFYIPSENKMHVLRAEQFRLLKPNLEEVDPMIAQPLVAGISQEDETCAAFSIFNCMRQMHYEGHPGNGMLSEWMKDEAGRMRLLTRSLVDYYMDGKHQDGVEEVAKHFGFQVDEIRAWSVKGFKKAILESARQWPVLLGFEIGKEMGQTPYEIYDHTYDQTYSRKIWLPKRPDQKSGGGHMILIRGVFETDEGEQFLVVHDPNWITPRLWSLDELNYRRTAYMEAHIVYVEPWDKKKLFWW